MMVGLQGSGKTTTAGKLASKLKKDGKKPFLVAADIYRPAAVEQLKMLGAQLGVPVFHEAGLQPPELCRRAREAAAKAHATVVIYDTAGRLAIDDAAHDRAGADQGRASSRRTSCWSATP